MIRHVLIFITVLLVIFPLSAQGREKTINILYTGSLHGQLETCGCSPKTDFGGLARISGFILENRHELSPYILIDAGNFTDKDTPQGRLKAETILKSFKIMQYDAVALLQNERVFPDDFFVSLIQKYKTPYVSDSFPCDRSLLVTHDLTEINISSDPAVRIEGKLNILLTEQSIADSKMTDGWDLIINSSGVEMDDPFQLNDSIIVAGYPRGKKLGILTLYIDNMGRVTNFKHRFEALGSDIKEDGMIRSVLDNYDSKVAELLKNAEQPSAGITYSGVLKCAECHEPFVESWEKTKHARAFASLEDTGKSLDPECLICHTVGFGESGGFYTIESTPKLANVQCEECHGLDREHLDDFSRPMRPVTVSVCLKCHTKENSPDFDYPVYYEKIKH